MSEISNSITHARVTSQDGTIIGYESIGKGPGLVVVHGGFRAGKHYRRLAQALSDAYTVHLIDRRGRGSSGPRGEGYTMSKECEDIAAVFRATNSAYVFGHSYGALAALETALTELPIRKMALYEPPIPAVAGFPTNWLPAFEQAMARNDALEAFAVFMKGMGLGPAFLAKTPKWLLKLMFRSMARGPEWEESVALLRTFGPEIKEGLRLDTTVTKYGAITCDTLILAGSKSPDWLLEPARQLEATIPHAKLLVLPGLDHNAPDENAPSLIAQQLRTAFA